MNVQRTLILIFLISNLSYAQDSKYRIQASFGLFSIMNPGTKSFDGVYRNDKNFSVYETEMYDIDYKNFTFSSGLHLKLGWNWVQKKKFTIRQTTSVAAEIYKEQIEFTLINIGNGDLNTNTPFPNETAVQVGYTQTAVASSLGIVASQELIYLRNLDNLSLGGGIAYTYRSRNDSYFNRSPSSSPYVPNSSALSSGQYETHQLGVVFHIEKAFTRSTVYLNLNQQFVTIKKQKGAKYYTEGNELNPISHNMDFRFPLLIQFGGSIQFGKNKK